MKKIQHLLWVLAFGLVVSISSTSSAQVVLQHVYVLNEGAYGKGNGSLTKTNYPTYSANTIPVNNPSNFGTSLYMANNKLYAAYDTVVYTVNPVNMQKIDSIFIEGVRVAKVKDSILYVTRDTPPYFQAYSLNTKMLKWSTIGLKGACEGFTMMPGNRAAVCVNGFGTEDTLAIINLSNGTIMQQYATALNPQDVYLRGTNLHVFCTTNFTNSAITTINLISSTINTVTTGLISYGGMTVDTTLQRMYFVATNGSFTTPKYWIKRFDLTTETLISGNTIDTVYTDAIYSICYDHINEQFFCGITDFFSFGKVNRYDKFGNLQDFFTTGTSPRSIVLQHGIGTTISENNLNNEKLTIYPNPVQDILNVEIDSPTIVQIFNTTGQNIKTLFLNKGVHQIDVHNLPYGLYYLRTDKSDTKFLKLD
ncbi:MAG: T9SS type A sorting domain-containing protein [Bacteroidia bacterium]|nr:T9SS type A sorting domain-containing protein [Bacteroidia bacterium]MDW8348482.1 T9SS type A sorting domain-containing protein [Bacteroidia bacterium]